MIYLEDIEKIVLSIASPKGIVREAVKIQFLSENEGELCMEIVENRNKSSYIYVEKVAQDIAQRIPEFYDLMQVIVDRIQKKLI